MNKKAAALLSCQVDPGEGDRSLWLRPVLRSYNLTRNKEKARHRRSLRYFLLFFYLSRLEEEELTFLALAAVSKQKAAM